MLARLTAKACEWSQDCIGGTKDSSPGAWDSCSNARQAALVEQGEDMLHNLLGQGIDGSSFMSMEQCASSSATSLEDVRQAQHHVAVSSQEDQDWNTQVS